MGGESVWHAVFDGLISTSKTRHFHNSTLLRGTCKTREGQRPRCPYDSESRAAGTLPLPCTRFCKCLLNVVASGCQARGESLGVRGIGSFRGFPESVLLVSKSPNLPVAKAKN